MVESKQLVVVTFRFVGLYRSDLVLEIFSVLFDDISGELVTPTQLFGGSQYQFVQTDKQVGIFREDLPQVLLQLLIFNLVIQQTSKTVVGLVGQWL